MLCAWSLTFFTKSDSTYIWSWRRWTSRHHRTTCLLFAWTHTGFHLSAAGILLLPPLFPHKKRRAPYHYHLFFSWLNLWCLLFKERRIIGTSLCARSVLTEPIWDKIKEVIRKFALKKTTYKLTENFKGDCACRIQNKLLDLSIGNCLKFHIFSPLCLHFLIFLVSTIGRW